MVVYLLLGIIDENVKDHTLNEKVFIQFILRI